MIRTCDPMIRSLNGYFDYVYLSLLNVEIVWLMFCRICLSLIEKDEFFNI
jgi:hypothetical protein